MRPRMLTEASGPFAYQLIGEEYVAQREGALLQWGYSTGKTRIGLTRPVRDERIVYTLIFCRLDNVKTISDEVKKHTNLPIVELTGSNRDVVTVVARYSSCVRSQRSPTVFILNYAKARYIKDELKRLEPEAVLVDESTNIKHFKSAQTKAIIEIGHMPQVVFRLCISGNMRPQDLSNYWAQFFFADKGKTFGSSFYWFMQNYYTKVEYDYILKPGARDIIMKKVAENSSIMPTSDVRIPKRIDKKLIELEPNDDQKYYLDMLSQGVIKMPDGSVYMLRGGTAQKEAQVCGGFIYLPQEMDEDNERVALPIGDFAKNPKTLALLGLLEDDLADRQVVGQPKIVVWAFYQWEIDQLMMLFQGIEDWNPVCLRGTNTVGMNSESKDRFEKDHKCRILIAQSDMGIGLNELVVADTSIWWSNSWKVESRDQSEMRFDRPGQGAHIINHIDLVIKDQADHAIALGVAYAKMDCHGFLRAAQILQAAKKKVGLG